MSILSTNKKLIKVEADYSAGSGISIDNYVISVTGDVGGKTYSAGENIGIYEQDNQLYISGKDWANDIEQASANAYNAATGDVAELAQTISETYYPNTNPSSFVNEDWVTSQGYITGVDLSEYAKRDFVLSSIESATSGKLDVSSFASVSSDFLTTSFEISESATWNDTSNVVQTNSAQWGQGGGVSGDYVPLSSVNCTIGYNNSAGSESLAQGYSNTADDYSLSQGSNNYAFKDCFAQGETNSAKDWAFSQGYHNTANNRSFSQGDTNSANDRSFSQGYHNSADYTSFSQGSNNYANNKSFSQGYTNSASNVSFTQGFNNSANDTSFSQGYANSAYNGSFTQGNVNSATYKSFSQGFHNSANVRSFSQGETNTANDESFSQGFLNTASVRSFSQGFFNKAQRDSLAQGNCNSACTDSLAVGSANSADTRSIAVGTDCVASECSQAFGCCVSATNSGMAIGTYNDVTTGAFVIGNGTSDTARSDCFVIDHEGNVSAAGKIIASSLELPGSHFKVDETVLWSGSWKPGNTTSPTNAAIEVSESIDNFEYIRVVTEGILCQVITVTPNQCQALICYPESDDRTSILGLKISKDDSTHIRFRCGYSTNFIQAYRSGSDWGYFTLKKIIGINRIAGGN